MRLFSWQKEGLAELLPLAFSFSFSSFLCLQRAEAEWAEQHAFLGSLSSSFSLALEIEFLAAVVRWWTWD